MAQMPTLTTPDIGSKYADLGKSIKTGLTEATAAGVKAYDDCTTEKAIYAVLEDYPELDKYYPKDMIIKSKMSPMEVARRAQAMDTASKAYDQKITEMPQGVPPQFPEKAAAMAGIFANPDGLNASISAWDGLVARAKGEQAQEGMANISAGLSG